MSKKDLTLKILEIIGYKNDKEAFVEDFFTTVKQRAVANTLQEISQEKLQALEKSSSSDQNVLINQLASEEQIEQAFKNEYDSLLSEWLNEIKSNLSTGQIKSLSGLLARFSSNQIQTAPPTQ